jgi:hypothetical protein
MRDGRGDGCLISGDPGVAAGEQVLVRAPGAQRGGLAGCSDDRVIEADLRLKNL